MGSRSNIHLGKLQRRRATSPAPCEGGSTRGAIHPDQVSRRLAIGEVGNICVRRNSKHRSAVWIRRQDHPNQSNAFGPLARYSWCVSMSEEGTLRHSGAPDLWLDRMHLFGCAAKLG